MKIEQNIIFTSEDFELLKRELPNNPCTKCDARIRGYCCGCSRGTSYSEYIKPYKDNNILDVALKVKQYKDTLKLIDEYRHELTELQSEIPGEILVKLKLY